MTTVDPWDYEESMIKQLSSLLKIAMAGAIIFAFGAFVVVTDEEGGVEEAKADIADWVDTATLVDGNFGRVVESTGIRPRPYLMNGNQVFFGVAYSRKSPQQLLDAYQEAFVEAGINEQKYDGVPDEKFKNSVADIENQNVEWSELLGAYNKEILNGGVVPIVNRPGYMAMGGMVPQEKGKDLQEVVTMFNGEFGKFEGTMKGFRFIDAQQMHPEMPTRITSVWAEDGFSFAKMGNPNQQGVMSTVDAPACMGCEVGTLMKSLAKDEPYSIAHFHGQRSPRQMVDFYNRTMATRGWEASDATKAVEYAREYIGGVPEARILSFQRGETLSSITIFPQAGGTSVTVVESE